MPPLPSPPPPAAVVERLRAAGCVFAEEEAALLVSAAATPADLERMVGQRVSGLPLEHILGWAEFCGLRVVVAPGVFVPRRRTELLVREAARLVEPPAVLVDLCCGSGAVGAALLATLDARGTRVELHAADVDPAAVACARENLPAEAPVHQGDLYAALPGSLRGRVDLLLANAPYVPTPEIAMMPPEARLHEARVALDGGPDGLDVQRRIIAGAAEWLTPGGSLLVETSTGQAPRTAAALEEQGFDVRTVRSEELAGTVVVGSRPRRSIGAGPDQVRILRPF